MATCNPATRAWCLYEWDHTSTFHGMEGLHLLGMTSEERNQIVQEIDVERAECFQPTDLTMILENVVAHHGSAASFNAILKLQLLLNPLSYKVDLKELRRRSVGCAWDLEPVHSLLETGSCIRALCVIAGAGTGKSTASVAMLDNVLGRSVSGLPGAWDGVATAYHFLKHNDERRLDPVRLMKSIAFQLALRIHSLRENLFKLDGRIVDKLSNADDAFKLLLEPLALIKEPVAILIDALDEADPIEEQEAGFDSSTHLATPVGNKTLRLVTGCLSKLPDSIRFIFTARPETACGDLKIILKRAFGDSVLYVGPHDLLIEDGREGRVLVCDTVVRECGLHTEELSQPVTSAPGLEDLYCAYGKLFMRGGGPSSKAVEVLEVLIAAREPLPISLTQYMGLAVHLETLPGWGTLFYAAEHRVFLLHKSLSDWLRLARRNCDSGKYAWASGGGGTGLAVAGDATLGAFLARAEAIDATDEKHVSEYALKYTLHHVCTALNSDGPPALLDLLNRVLANWSFLKEAITAGYGPAMVSSLGNLVAFNSAGCQSLTYARDALGWLRNCHHDIETRPEEMETITLKFAPIGAPKYFEATQRLRAASCYAVLGGELSNQRDSWPPGHSVFKVHAYATWDMSISCDGRWLTTCSEDSTALVRSTESGQVVATLNHHAVAMGVTMSQNGRWLAFGHVDSTLSLWDVVCGQKCAVLEGHSDGVRKVAFSPDGSVLASCSNDMTVRLWKVQGHTGNLAYILRGHTSGIPNVVFSPDGCIVASCSDDRSTRLWDVKSGQLIRTLEGHLDTVYAAGFSPDGLWLATVSFDLTIRLWSTDSWTTTKTLTGHTGPLLGVSFNADSDWLATCSKDGTARLWEVSSGSLLATFEGYADHVRKVLFGPGSRMLATCSRDKTVRLWDTKHWITHSTASTQIHQQAVTNVALSPDGNYVAASLCDNTIWLWDVITAKKTSSLQGYDMNPRYVAFSHDGRLLGTSSMYFDILVWNISSSQLLCSIVGHKDNVMSISFSPIGTYLATGSCDRSIILWDLSSFQAALTLSGHAGAVVCMAFSRDGHLLASGSEDENVCVWETATWQPKFTLQGVDGCITNVVFSPNGNLLATFSRNNCHQIWDVITGTLVTTVANYPGPVLCATYNYNGDLLGVGSLGSDAYLIKDQAGVEQLSGHRDKIMGAVFSSDGGSIATFACDFQIRVWKLESMKLQHPRKPLVGSDTAKSKLRVLNISEQRTSSTYFQAGRLRIESPMKDSLLPPVSTYRVDFPSPFLRSPCVVVGLARFDVFAAVQIEARAEDITVNGFILKISSMPSAFLFTVDVTWVASMTDQVIMGVTGEIVLKADRKVRIPVLFHSNIGATPQVWTSLCMFDAQNTQNVRISTAVENITSTGFEIVAETWCDSITRAMSVSWIAFGDRNIFRVERLTIGSWPDSAITESSPKSLLYDIPWDGHGIFDTIVGIHRLDMDNGHRSCITVDAAVVEPTLEENRCVCAQASCWGAGKVWSVGVSIISVFKSLDDDRIGEAKSESGAGP